MREYVDIQKMRKLLAFLKEELELDTLSIDFRIDMDDDLYVIVYCTRGKAHAFYFNTNVNELLFLRTAELVRYLDKKLIECKAEFEKEKEQNDQKGRDD